MRCSIEKVFLSSKIYFAGKNYKCFIGYLDNDHKVKSLYLMLHKTRPYVKSYDEQTKWMNFLIVDEGLIKKYNTI